MKLFFTKKNFMQKMIICIVMVLLVNFTLAPSYSQASLGDDLGNMFFNILLRCGDGIIWVVQKVIYGMDSSFITIDRGSNWRGTLAKVLAGVGIAATVVAGIAATVASGGTAAPAAIAIIAKVATGIGIAAFVGAGAAGISQSKQELKAIDNNQIPPTLYLPIINISPDAVFNNQIGLTDVNFFNPSRIQKVDGENTYYIDTNGNGSYEENTDTITTQSTAAMLRDSITKWYYSIRNLSLVGLLSVLIYVGIRIILSSSTTEKAKYKSMITDWVVAICLVMVLHYIMVFAITLVEKITYALGTATSSLSYYSIADKKTIEEVKDTELANFIMTEGGQEVFVWPVNLLGSARMESQFLSVYSDVEAEEEITSDEDEGIDTNQTVMQKMAYTVIYLALIFFTIYFLFYYIRRVVYLAFLTLIAPLIALTYPIDKINDGSAQGFSVWLKEYMYNLLIQPFHLLLYTIFITTAFEFAKSNVIYVCVVLGFLMSAEKLLRKMFNFNKSETASAFSGAAAGSMMATALSKAASKAKSLGSHSKGSKGLGSGGSGGKGDGDDGDGVKPTSDMTSGFGPKDDLDSKDDEELTDEEKEEKRQQRNEELKNGIDEKYDSKLNDAFDKREKYNLDTDKDKAEQKLKNQKDKLLELLKKDADDKEREDRKQKEKQKKIDKREAKRAPRNVLRDAKRELRNARMKRFSDKFRKGALGKLTRPARVLGKKIKDADAADFYNKVLATPMRYTLGGLGAGIGTSLMFTSSLALDDSAKEVATKTALGGTGGFAIGAGGANAIEAVGSWGGNVGNTLRNYSSDYRYMKNADIYGQEEANRLRDIENKEYSEAMSKYLDKYHPDLSKKERKSMAHEYAEYATDTGLDLTEENLKTINKVSKAQKNGEIDKGEAKSLAIALQKYNKIGQVATKEQKARFKEQLENNLIEQYVKHEIARGDKDVRKNKKKMNKIEQTAKDQAETQMKLIERMK